MSLATVTLGHPMSLKQRLASRRAVIRTAVLSPPHSDGKSLARRHAFRLAAPCSDLAMLAPLIARHLCHAGIIRRGWPSGKGRCGSSRGRSGRLANRCGGEFARPSGAATGILRIKTTTMALVHGGIELRLSSVRARLDRRSILMGPSDPLGLGYPAPKHSEGATLTDCYGQDVAARRTPRRAFSLRVPEPRHLFPGQPLRL